MNNKHVLLVIFSLFLLPFPSEALSKFSIHLEIPLYGQNLRNYCGPACSQIMMMGYPEPEHPACHRQKDIWKKIQKYKTDCGFYSDPDGILGAITELNPLQKPLTYSIVSDTDREVVLAAILNSMAEYNYPAVTLINGGKHWVVITGFTTDIDPRTGSTRLESIEVNDPLPRDWWPHDNPCTPEDEGFEWGKEYRVTGNSWFTRQWKKANRFGSEKTWKNKYIAITVTPHQSGRVTAKEEVSSGNIITRQEAKNSAIAAAAQIRSESSRGFPFLDRSIPDDPLLINKERQAYYIVPYRAKNSTLYGVHAGAVLVNAYNGSFQEVVTFQAPVEYVSKQQAVKIGLSSIRKSSTQSPIAELIYPDSLEARSRHLPVWKVSMWPEGAEHLPVIRYVDQFGLVFQDLQPAMQGGG